jgi:peroxiredoxin
MALRIGDRLPPIELIDHRGDRWRTDDRRDHPLVLILHRHLA